MQILRVLFLVFSILSTAACGGRTSGNNDSLLGDAAPIPDAALEATPMADALVGLDAEGGTSAESDADAAEPLPTLEFAFNGPAANDIYMGEAARMFCFSLRANGASFDLGLPLSKVRGVSDGSVVTDSVMGTVFGGGVVWEGSQPVVDTGMIDSTPDAIVFSNLPMETFTVAKDTTRLLCIDVDVTGWSKTPDDFYGKSYRFEMGDWIEGSVVFSGTTQPLPRAQIIAPTNVNGNTFRILSKDGSTHPERYAGTLHVALGSNTPPGMNLLPGASYVRMTTIQFSADGTGSCLREFVTTDHGTGSDGGIEYVWLYTDPLPGHQTVLWADGTQLTGKKSTISYNPGHEKSGFLFCLDGGTSTSFTIAVGISATAEPGTTHEFDIWNLLTDVNVVQGSVDGFSPIVGNTFTIISP
ncbi:MAG: hypothetical protein WC762_13670 [Methylobacter sp.]|jgi:hypothetical protein